MKTITTGDNSKVRTSEILKKVRQIEIRTNRLVNDALSGEYHSVFKGRGMDFDEVREYFPGDEVRMIDWNVTARTGTPFIKKFTEERELTIMLLVDVSASGNFGSGKQSKRELAAEVASVLAFSAIGNRDKVGLVLFSDQIEAYIPPAKGRRHVLRVVREILYFQPQHKGTDITAALEFANQVLKRRAVVFLLSDFWFSTPAQNKQEEHGFVPPTRAGKKKHDSVTWEGLQLAMRLTQKHHDLIAMNIFDSKEHELPEIGLLTLEDAETGEQFELDTNSSSLRKNFSLLAHDRLESLRQLTRSSRVDTLELQTNKPYLPELIKFFGMRGARRR